MPRSVDMCAYGSDTCNNADTPPDQRRWYFKIWERRRYGPPAYTEIRDWHQVGFECYRPGEVPPNTVRTPPVRQLGWVDVYNAIRTETVAKKRVVVEPPGGRTVINFATNVYTTDAPWQKPNLTLTGFPGLRIDARAKPADENAYRWNFGDGTTLVTDGPGSAYPDLDITHKYTKAHVTVGISVTTTYTAEYRVNGGTWQPIPQPIVVPGPAVQVQILESKPKLAAPECNTSNQDC